MKRLIGILIIIGILALVGFGGYVVYNLGYLKGETAGYDRGYAVGEGAGFSSGKQDGINEGYVSGRQDGYNEGYESGKADGYEEGVEAGLGHGYTLRDPTYREAVNFLKKDKTDSNEYVEGIYVCNHFARDVCNNAEAEGLRCAYVGLVYAEGGHAIIAFETVDRGLSYFEPQSDERVVPVIGKQYYQCVEVTPGYYYEEPSYDDTISDIIIIW
jgi:hypothetical protein